MTREDYQDRLERLRETVIALGDLVRDQLADGFSALFASDRSLAREVIASDRTVNRRSLEIEGECLDLLALYQPVAGDLRQVIATFKIVTDLERVGDLATNLAEYTLASTGSAPTLPDVDFERIAALALELVEDAIEAFVTDDVDACFAVADRDDELDARCEAVTERVVRTLIDLRVDGDAVNSAQAFPTESDEWPLEDVLTDVSRTLVIVRDVERVGDHAVNVAARTLYALENSEELLA
ncbi:phosphate signaling complex protein PhoU [Natrinema limicola]|uniref:Phosphate-specific transport system accessory protein PhoU n=1 Tax=Natrinema limicola JCM 13563 TaxID=1230457 RepID=M0C642_9EURY|nr:phosphate signaling complex protein PhoU [Natrinema limicola]ELZ18108.1 phosphate transport system regulatory protein PhoU [Natrinema limicola JCM 13563]